MFKVEKNFFLNILFCLNFVKVICNMIFQWSFGNVSSVQRLDIFWNLGHQSWILNLKQTCPISKYVLSWLVSSLSTTQTTFWWGKIILNLSCVSQFWKEGNLLIQPKDLNIKTLKCHNSPYIGTKTKIDDSILLLMKSSYIFW